MKFRIVGILFFLYFKSTSWGQVTLINSGSNSTLNQISVKKNNIAVYGFQDFIKKSYNECNSLTPQTIPNPGVFTEYQRIDSNLLFAFSSDISAYDFKLFKSINDGQSWVKIFDSVGGPTLFQGIAFFNSNEGLIFNGGVSGNKHLRTTNSGNSWFQSSDKYYFGYSAIKTFGDSMIIVGGLPGGGAEINYSKDRGQSWVVPKGCYSVDGTGTIRDIFFLNKDTIFVTGPGTKGAMLLKSFDGGKNWSCSFAQPIIDGYGIQFVNAQEGYICGVEYQYPYKYGVILKTKNQGLSWEYFNTGVKEILYDMEFINDSTMLVSGANGTLFKVYMKKAIFTNIKEQGSNTSIEIFPNPVKDEITITVNENSPQIKNIIISNTLGQIVYKVTEVNQKIDVSFLPAGIYYLKLQNEKGQKIVKLLKE